MSRRAVEWYDVSDVFHARYVHHKPLEAEAETGVGSGAVAVKIEIPPIRFEGQTGFKDAPLQHVVALLSLRTSDNLADAGSEDVHRTNGLPVVVRPHVEGLDFFRIVREDHRTAD